MKITAEVSLYPLSEEYGHIVLDFLEVLKKQTHIQWRTNSMSTQLLGEWDDVMTTLKNCYAAVSQSGIKAPLVVKIFNEGLEMEWLAIPKV